MRRFVLLAGFFGMITSAFAQDSSLVPLPLNPITSQNADQLVQIRGEGIGYGGTPYWSVDEQIIYFDSISGGWEYHLNDLEHPQRFDELPIPRPDIQQTIPDPIATSPDGRFSVRQETSGDDERSAIFHVVDTTTGTEVKTIAGDAAVMRTYSGRIFIPLFYDNGLLFLRQSALYRWQPEIDTEELLIEKFMDISISPTGRYAVTYALTPMLSNETEFRIWDLATAPANMLYEHIFPAMDAWHSIAFNPNGQQLATGGSNSNVRLWDTASMSHHDTNPPNEYGENEIVDLEYSPDGRFLAGCISSIALGSAFVIDSISGENLATIQGEFGSGYSYFASVAFNPRDQKVLFGSADGLIHGWTIDTLIGLRETTIDTAERIFSGHTESVMAIAISPNGEQIASASWDNTVRLWDYETGELINMLALHTAPVWGVAFSPDGKLLATSAEDGTVQIWNLETQQHTVLANVTGERDHQAPKPLVTDLEFSPDGSILAGSEFNGKIHIWDINQGVETRLLDGNEILWHLAFNQEGTLLATANTVGDVKIWGVEEAG